MSEANKYTPDYFKTLDPDLTDEEARSLARRWNYQRPNDPMRDLNEAHRGHKIEREWRELLRQKNTGEITEDEYQQEMERRTSNPT